jgi:hypothetical protein
MVSVVSGVHSLEGVADQFLLLSGVDGFADHFAGELDGEVGASFGQVLKRLIGGGVDVADGAVTFGLCGLAGVGEDLLAGGFGVAASFLQKSTHFAGGGGEPGFVLGQ